MRAVNSVILYPNKCKRPKPHITPISTTANDSNIVLTDLKNINNIIADSANEPSKNHFISVFILSATNVFIKGSPLNRVSIFVASVKAFVFTIMLFMDQKGLPVL